MRKRAWSAASRRWRSSSRPAAATTTSGSGAEAPTARDAPADTAAPRRRVGGADDDDRRPTAPTTGWRAAECETVDDVSLQLQWFIQSPVRRLPGRDRPGLLRGALPERRDPRGRRRHRAAAGAGRRPGRLRHRLGAQGARRRGSRAPTSPTSPRSSSARARCRCRSRTHGITIPADFAGKNVGNWGFGNEYEIFAALDQAGLDPATDVNARPAAVRHARPARRRHRRRRGDDVQRVRPGARGREPGDRASCTRPRTSTSSRTRRSASACCRTPSGPTARGWTPTRRTVDVATRFLAASIEGWAYCRDNPEACRDIVVAAGSQLGDSHQLWQMNEINKLIWPAEDGIGTSTRTPGSAPSRSPRTRRTSKARRC